MKPFVDSAHRRCYSLSAFVTDTRTLDAVPRHRVWLTTLALAVLGCGGPFPQTTLHPQSDFGWAIQHLFSDIFWWAVLVFVTVEAALVYTIVRYRHRPGGPAPKPLHGHTALEIGWTIAPALILLFIAVPTMRTIFATAGEAPASALKVEVVGHQWWWEYKYPGLGVVTANELHVPVGQPVQLSITSADVIHSFWAPGIGGKRDAIPGHVNRIAFRADSTGDYSGQCAEFCGVSHANMRLRVFVDSDSAFQAWLKLQQGGPAPIAKGSLAERGEQIFSKSPCIGCHTMEGIAFAKGVVGPNLTHVGSRATIAGGIFPNDSLHLAQWIADAPSLKPGSLMTKMMLSEADLAALVAYLRSMK